MLYLICFIILLSFWLYFASKKSKPAKTISIIKTTFSSLESAHSFCKTFCDLKLIACGSVYKVDSFFNWDGKLQKTDEYIVEAKTHNVLVPQVVAKIQGYHPYKTPQIVFYTAKCNNDYYNWLSQTLQIQETKPHKTNKSKKIKDVNPQDEQK